MHNIGLTTEDLSQMDSLGISESQLQSQIEIFKNPSFQLKLARACTLADGVGRIEPADMEKYLRLQQEAADSGRFIKFIPASGAATRMFQVLYQVYETYGDSFATIRQQAQDGDALADNFIKFFENIKSFPFYDDLKDTMDRDGISLDEVLSKAEFKTILEYLLTATGLSYGSLPKGLLKFHCYFTGCRTPFEEHLYEAAHYIKDQQKICRLHFTISPEHETRFIQLVQAVKPLYEEQCQAHFDLGFSFQKHSTDTIAVDLDNNPFRDKNGRLLFRPAGHGALLENLKDLKADLVYMKNIDNVAPDHLKEQTFLWHKILGGYLVEIQQNVHRYIRLLREGRFFDHEPEIEDFLVNRLLIRFSPDFPHWSSQDREKYLLAKLRRPIRVCGMVPNTGEPGGGPFWVQGRDQISSPQIVEKAQVDLHNPDQKAIWESSTYFNPVELVCALRDEEGNFFNLSQYVDRQAVFISQKSKDGKVLKALELPGLWNGSMADWTTIFMEIPGETFYPVKTVDDLLRPEHQPARPQ